NFKSISLLYANCDPPSRCKIVQRQDPTLQHRSRKRVCPKSHAKNPKTTPKSRSVVLNQSCGGMWSMREGGIVRPECSRRQVELSIFRAALRARTSFAAASSSAIHLAIFALSTGLPSASHSDHSFQTTHSALSGLRRSSMRLIFWGSSLKVMGGWILVSLLAPCVSVRPASATEFWVLWELSGERMLEIDMLCSRRGCCWAWDGDEESME
ncbi:uncharacterized protein IWZ02DRAFT_522425, partial [Phyllosticta citriasiana]|uniref:uncharacterized protein n=1 Tax=Phyllosticta citriasiana TaxID=595635 RepID=UPI0030FDEAAD